MILTELIALAPTIEAGPVKPRPVWSWDAEPDLNLATWEWPRG